MTFGFPAYHVRTERYRATDAHLLALARETVLALSWQVTGEDDDGLRARNRVNLWTWGELITITVAGGAISVKSACLLSTQCFDWGKNERNVTAFFERMPPPVVDELDAAHASSGAPVGAGALLSGTGQRRD